MDRSNAFFSVHRQGFVRVAACTPRISVGDPVFNGAETLAMMRQGHARHADLMLFPELGLSAYAIDDLLLQDALLDGVEDALRRLVEASRDISPVIVVGAPVRRNGRLYNCGVAFSRGRILGAVPKSFLPNYREYLRKPVVCARCGRNRSRGVARRSDGPVRRGYRFRRNGPAGFRVSSGDLRGLLVRESALHARRPGRRIDPMQSIRVEHRHRKSGRSGAPVRIAVDALPGSICLLGCRAGRKHDRSRVGWPGDDSRDGGCYARPSVSPRQAGWR